jgi:chemotaxis protein MotB
MGKRPQLHTIIPCHLVLMFGAQPKKAANQGNVDQALTWYAWEDVRKDDSWLVSYVDLLIILLAVLVVLIGQMAPRHVALGTPVEASTARSVASPMSATTSSDRHEPDSLTAQRPGTQARGLRLAALVTERFQGEIRAAHGEQGVTLEISDAVLFDSARATLRESASSMLIRLAATLQESGDALVAVEGHTDNRPVQSGDFRSNWELAAARAYAVTRFLIDQGLAADRLRAVSYADTRPTADNETPEGRAANRRVELRVEFLPE